jgi:hypothetical protein
MATDLLPFLLHLATPRYRKGKRFQWLMGIYATGSYRQLHGICRFFTGAPAALERAVPGLNILSSAYGSVRADSGLCERHGAFTTARRAACPQFEFNGS